MTLQTSGAIRFDQIQAEFGGSDPISLSEYYAGGTYVPSGTSGTNGAVPSSGAISMSKFYGTSAVIVTIPSATQNVIAYATGSSSAWASFNFNNPASGDYSRNATPTFGTVTKLGTWVTPGSRSSDYEAYPSVTASSGPGSITSMDLNTWTGLGPIQAIGLYRDRSAFGIGVSSRTISIQIRKVGTTTVLGTFTVYLEATNESNL